jgi:hypothetical protein
MDWNIGYIHKFQFDSCVVYVVDIWLTLYDIHTIRISEFSQKKNSNSFHFIFSMKKIQKLFETIKNWNLSSNEEEKAQQINSHKSKIEVYFIEHSFWLVEIFLILSHSVKVNIEENF